MAEAVSEQTIDCAASSLCSVCIHPVKDARVLSCLHSFCKTCIDDLHLNSARDSEVSCPLCRARTRLPNDGAAGLAKDVTRASSNREFECKSCKRDDTNGKPEAWCKECDTAFCKENIVSHLVSTGHPVFPLPDRLKSPAEGQDGSSSRLCSQHKIPLRYFCKMCKLAVCGDCVLLGAHVNHKLVVTMKEISEELQQSARENIDLLETVSRPRLEESLTTVKDVSLRLSSRAGKCRSQVRTTGEFAVHTIQAIVEQQLVEVDDVETVRLKELEEQEDFLKRQLDSVNSCLAFGKQVMRRIDSMGDDVADLLSVLDTRAESLVMTTPTKARIQHARAALRKPLGNEVLVKAMKMLSEALVESASAHRSHLANTDQMKQVVIGSSVDIVVVLNNYNGEKLTRGGDEVEARMLGDGRCNGPVADLQVIDRENGTYLISCAPQQVVGKYTVEVSINGEKMPEELFLLCVGKPGMMTFDPHACGRWFRVSHDRLTAQLNCDQTALHAAFGNIGMRIGSHTWKVHVKSTSRQQFLPIHIGVAEKQGSVVSRSSRRRAKGRVWCWSGSTGDASMGGRWQQTSMSALEAGDVLCFQLDCTRHVLRLTNLRSGESDKINLPGVELFAYFRLRRKCDSVSFLM